jgi:hypothetical protein
MSEPSNCTFGPRPTAELDTKAKFNAFKQKSVESHSPLTCSGSVFVGIFFDGTGNNEKQDYDRGKVTKEKQKHSNIARLLLTYKDKVRDGTNSFYRYYVPGVGTPFEEIGDEGGSMGGGFGAVGEQRLIWALIQVFNAVHLYSVGGNLILPPDAKTYAQNLGGMGSTGWQRNAALKDTWQKKLEEVIRKPKVENIVVDVFGFSRGAAQARAFCNWLYGLCDQQGSDPATATYLFAGIKLKIRFLGIFDTVASVGIGGTSAGGLLESDGHHSWAYKNLQIHPAITHCEHYVAAHEVRGSFPLDSARIDGKYPSNVHEAVYPGSHSDVGGGYAPNSQGKSESFARIPGFAMYQAALTWGVPLFSLNELKTQSEDDYNNLLPANDAIDAYNAYLKAVGPEGAPVEKQHVLHMGWYHSYRYQAGVQYGERAFARRANAVDRERLLKSQRDFATAMVRVAASMRSYWSKSDPAVGVTTPDHWTSDSFVFRYNANAYLSNPLRADQVFGVWQSFKRSVARDGGKLLLHDRADLDVAQIMDNIRSEPLPAAVVHFFDNYIHDSMGGFIEQVDEFSFNGYGLLKYRRIFFGDNGEAFLSSQRRADNARRAGSAKVY